MRPRFDLFQRLEVNFFKFFNRRTASNNDLAGNKDKKCECAQL